MFKLINMDSSTVNELLLFLLRGNPDEPPPTDIAQLAEPDWDSVAQQARKHALEPLLYQQLKKRPQAVPAAVLRGLQTKYFACAWRNNNLYQELAKVLNALREEGIPVILLKGAHLVKIIYGNIALRSVGDVDVLVRKADLLKAKERLLELGYTPFRETDIATACAVSHHLSPMVKQDAPPVELHWTLEAPTTPFIIDIEGLWRRARPASVAGVDTLTLSPEDLLLHLCLHTSAHHLYANGLRAFCDIRETICHYRDELNWETVQNRAREWGAGNAVYLTLYFAKSFLGADVPDDFLKKHRPVGFTSNNIKEFKRIIFRQGPESISVVKLYHLMSVAEKVRFFLGRIFLSPEELGGKYLVPSNSPMICLYYFIRLKDVLLKYRRTVWRIWSRDKATVRQFELVDWLSR